MAIFTGLKLSEWCEDQLGTYYRSAPTNRYLSIDIDQILIIDENRVAISAQLFWDEGDDSYLEEVILLLNKQTEVTKFQEPDEVFAGKVTKLHLSRSGKSLVVKWSVHHWRNIHDNWWTYHRQAYLLPA